MAVPSGLSLQIGTAEESTYGTAVTVDTFFEARSEAFTNEITPIESSALRAGSLGLRSNRWAQGQRSINGGELAMEMGNKSFGRWFKHAFGAVSTSQPDATAAPSVYQHVFTPAELPTGQTIQVGRATTAGVVEPFTYTGCKIQSWVLSCAMGEHVLFTPTIVGRDEDTSTALATASYPADLDVLNFVGGSVTIDGTAQDVRSASLSGTNGLATDRYFLGSALRKEPLTIGAEGSQARIYTGQLEAEFESLTAYNRFKQGTEAEMVLLFEGANIESTFSYHVKVTANVRFNGTTPTVPDANIVQQPLPFKAIDNGTTFVSLEYQTTDATV